MSQLARFDDPVPGPVHNVTVVESWHWRGSKRYRASCEAGCLFRKHLTRELAVIDGDTHAALRRGTFTDGGPDA